MQVSADEKRSCRVLALQVREAYGLIWLSAVPAEQASFPELDGPVMTTRRRAFEFGGDFGVFFAKDSLLHGICHDPRLLPANMRLRAGVSAYSRTEEIPTLPVTFDRSLQPGR